MDKKAWYAIVVVIILIIAVVAVYFVYFTGDDDNGEPTDLDNAELKVYGNINGDRYLDERDAGLIQELIDDGYTAKDYPLADANQDGFLDSKDIDVINAVIKGESTTIWHVNYHDMDGNGTMDEEIVSTQFPISSIIVTGSTNTFLVLMMLGIVDQVKGASYSASSVDTALFGDTYLNTAKVVQVGDGAQEIEIESGAYAAANVIAEQHVTAVISDWNRGYIDNEDEFEAIGVDVVRIAAASLDEDVMTHSACLLGLLLQLPSERVDAYLDLNFEVLDYMEGATAGKDSPKAVASSMTGRISTGTSDYTAVILRAGGTFGLEGFNFGSSSSVKIEEYPDIYTYDFQYIIHMRTGLAYGQTDESNADLWNTCTEPFADWQYADTGQYIVSGSLPVVLRVAYTAAALYDDVDLDMINQFHQRYVDELYDGLSFDISSMKFLICPGDY